MDIVSFLFLSFIIIFIITILFKHNTENMTKINKNKNKNTQKMSNIKKPYNLEYTNLTNINDLYNIPGCDNLSISDHNIDIKCVLPQFNEQYSDTHKHRYNYLKDNNNKYTQIIYEPPPTHSIDTFHTDFFSFRDSIHQNSSFREDPVDKILMLTEPDSHKTTHMKIKDIYDYLTKPSVDLYQTIPIYDSNTNLS
jgi:hypothetical protein